MPFKQVFFGILTSWGHFPRKPHKFRRQYGNPSQNEKVENSLALEDRQNMAIMHDYELGVTLSESIIENYVRRPLADISL